MSGIHRPQNYSQMVWKIISMQNFLSNITDHHHSNTRSVTFFEHLKKILNFFGSGNLKFSIFHIFVEFLVGYPFLGYIPPGNTLTG